MADVKYNWVDNCCVSGVSQCNTDILNDCLMHLKYDNGGLGMPVGTIYPLNCTSVYVPEGSLPTDGAEYTKAQFSNLWNDYLTGEITAIPLPIIIGTMSVTLVGRPTTSATNFNATFYFKVGADVTTKQNILSGFGVYIENGRLYGNANGVDTEFADIKILPNDEFAVKVMQTTDSVYVIAKVGTSSATLPYTTSIGTSRTFSFAATNENCYMLASSTINGEPIYSNGSFHSMISTSDGIISEINIYKVLTLLNTCTYAEYEADLATYGQCAKFAVDLDNETFRVPLIKDGAVVQQAMSDGELGKSYNAGLPNITANWKSEPSDDAYGSVYTEIEDGNIQAVSAGGSTDTRLYFDASRSSTVYGNSDTVQPNAVALRYFVVVATGSINQSMMDWSAWASSLQGKANTTDVLNKVDNKDCVAYVTETYVNGTSWYRVYSDGRCEQGGYNDTKTATTVITLLKAYKDLNYTLTATWRNTGTLSTYSPLVNATANDSFTVYHTDNGAQKVGQYWEAKGYIS